MRMPCFPSPAPRWTRSSGRAIGASSTTEHLSRALGCGDLTTLMFGGERGLTSARGLLDASSWADWGTSHAPRKPRLRRRIQLRISDASAYRKSQPEKQALIELREING